MNKPAFSRPSMTALCDEIAHGAGEEHRTGDGIAGSVDILRRAGLLDDSGAHDPAATARMLMRIAGANLSLARLYEGHVNALRIVELHGTPTQRQRMTGMAGNGAFFGVWGADSEDPLRQEDNLLAGAKIYASGLGAVTHAIVTVQAPESRIGLIRVDDVDRQDASGWDMPGMRATRSGRYDFTGVPAEDIGWIGDPGCYTTEPGFVGGVWRIAALQLGATLGLIDAAGRHLRALGRMTAEAQLTRLTPSLMRAMAAEGLVLRAARFAERDAPHAPEKAVALSAAARLLTEEIAQQAIAATEQSIGLSHFDAQSCTGRIAADLSVYLRQAARDALLQRVGSFALTRDASAWDMMS